MGTMRERQREVQLCRGQVAFRWFGCAGGVRRCLCPSVSGRCLSFGEREDIALFRAQGLGVGEIARRLDRSPSTVSRELRRNASTPPAMTAVGCPQVSMWRSRAREETASRSQLPLPLRGPRRSCDCLAVRSQRVRGRMYHLVVVLTIIWMCSGNRN